jgi:drug/metabolite transporter (DMT)-like permease
MTAAVFGILSAVIIGTSDFVAARVARKVGPFFTLLYSMITSFVILVIGEIVLEYPLFHGWDWAILFGCGFAAAAAYFAFYRALEVGPVSLVAPIASADGMIATAFGVFLFGEILSRLQEVGVLVVLGSIFLVSTNLKQFKRSWRHPSRGVPLALVTMLGFGIGLTMISRFSITYGWFVPILGIRAGILLPLLIYSAAKKQWRAKGKASTRTMGLVMLIGALETTALLCYAHGATLHRAAPTALIAPLYSTFPMFTILLAFIFFKERPVLNQWVGIAGIIAGMLLLAF